jgi:hypothetical protein
MSATRYQQPTSPVVPIRLGHARAGRRARRREEFYASLGEDGGEEGE